MVTFKWIMELRSYESTSVANPLKWTEDVLVIVNILTLSDVRIMDNLPPAITLRIL